MIPILTALFFGGLWWGYLLLSGKIVPRRTLEQAIHDTEVLRQANHSMQAMIRSWSKAQERDKPTHAHQWVTVDSVVTGETFRWICSEPGCYAQSETDPTIAAPEEDLATALLDAGHRVPLLTSGTVTPAEDRMWRHGDPLPVYCYVCGEDVDEDRVRDHRKYQCRGNRTDRLKAERDQWRETLGHVTQKREEANRLLAEVRDQTKQAHEAIKALDAIRGNTKEI